MVIKPPKSPNRGLKDIIYMKKIRIEYRYLGIFFKELEIEVPERWEDLNERQFCVCSEIYINPLSDAEFISRFFGIKKNVVEKIGKFGQYKFFR